MVAHGYWKNRKAGKGKVNLGHVDSNSIGWWEDEKKLKWLPQICCDFEQELPPSNLFSHSPFPSMPQFQHDIHPHGLRRGFSSCSLLTHPYQILTLLGSCLPHSAVFTIPLSPWPCAALQLNCKHLKETDPTAFNNPIFWASYFSPSQSSHL